MLQRNCKLDFKKSNRAKKENKAMAKYKFLSPEWVEEARKIRESSPSGSAGALPQSIKMNLVITEVPFGDGTVNAHVDSTGGQMEMELGHLDDAEVKVTIDYETAKSTLIDGNPQAAMQAFMAGKIRVEGDMAKLMALQTATPDAESMEMAKKLQDITE
jgi:putative sterol carrier protein